MTQRFCHCTEISLPVRNKKGSVLVSLSSDLTQKKLLQSLGEQQFFCLKNYHQSLTISPPASSDFSAAKQSLMVSRASSAGTSGGRPLATSSITRKFCPWVLWK